jgi:hypothetical protein
MWNRSTSTASSSESVMSCGNVRLVEGMAGGLYKTDTADSECAHGLVLVISDTRCQYNNTLMQMHSL